METSQKERCIDEQGDSNRSDKLLPRVNVDALKEINLRLAFIDVGDEDKKSDYQQNKKNLCFDFGSF